jgi:hypothetical protein
VFFLSNDSGMTEINANKPSINNNSVLKMKTQKHKAQDTHIVIPHMLLANMTVEQRRRDATVS